jgi:hypothetical protein
MNAPLPEAEGKSSPHHYTVVYHSRNVSSDFSPSFGRPTSRFRRLGFNDVSSGYRRSISAQGGQVPIDPSLPVGTAHHVLDHPVLKILPP